MESVQGICAKKPGVNMVEKSHIGKKEDQNKHSNRQGRTKPRHP